MLVFMKKNCCQAYVFISGIKYDNYGQTVKLTLVILNPRLPSLQLVLFIFGFVSSSNCQKEH